MIDIIEPSREYSVQEFKKESEEVKTEETK
jgi:tRNA A37 N6-isopentenylltransferase MiaA